MADYLDDDTELDDVDGPTFGLTGDDVNCVADDLDDLQADAAPGTSRADVRHTQALDELRTQSAHAAGANRLLGEVRDSLARQEQAARRVPLRNALAGQGGRRRLHRGNSL